MMDDLRQKKIRAWNDVLLWVVMIYSTLYVVRPVCEYLKKVTPFAALINIILWVSLAGIITAWYLKINIKKPSTYLLLLTIVVIYFFSFLKIKYPEEKIHFIEYGCLGFLTFRAWRLNFSLPVAYLCAFLLTSLLGWGDEGIQGLLLSRYYQISDVILNSYSGVLGLFLTFIFQREMLE